MNVFHLVLNHNSVPPSFPQTPLLLSSSVAGSLAASLAFVLLAAVASASPIAAPGGEFRVALPSLPCYSFSCGCFLAWRKSFSFFLLPLWYCFYCLPKLGCFFGLWSKFDTKCNHNVFLRTQSGEKAKMSAKVYRGHLKLRREFPHLALMATWDGDSKGRAWLSISKSILAAEGTRPLSDVSVCMLIGMEQGRMLNMPTLHSRWSRQPLFSTWSDTPHVPSPPSMNDMCRAKERHLCGWNQGMKMPKETVTDMTFYFSPGCYKRKRWVRGLPKIPEMLKDYWQRERKPLHISNLSICR